jgi:hypothetical protein
MKVFTTINPNGNFDAQLEAINSWSNKYEVYSVNTKEEIEKISSVYTSVKFIETDITYQYNNKKLIKLNSILNDLRIAHKDQDTIKIDSEMEKLNESWNRISTNLYSQVSQDPQPDSGQPQAEDVNFEEVK